MCNFDRNFLLKSLKAVVEMGRQGEAKVEKQAEAGNSKGGEAGRSKGGEAGRSRGREQAVVRIGKQGRWLGSWPLPPEHTRRQSYRIVIVIMKDVGDGDRNFGGAIGL